MTRRPLDLTQRQVRRPQRSPLLEDSLFPGEAEIARRLGQAPAEWAAKAIVLEREGLPRIDPLMGARYWPAVAAYFARRAGLYSIGPPQPDGGEDLDALR